MMDEKYAQIVSICEEMSAIAADAQITAQLQHTKQLIENRHLPTVALVDMGSAGRALPDAASAITETAVPVILKQALTNRPACLTLTHADTVNLYRISNEGSIQIPAAGIKSAEYCPVDELELEFPCDALKANRLILCGCIEDHNAWIHLFENMDVVILRINATAAMNQAERNWIDNELIPMFGDKQVAIWIDLLEHLNTEEDRVDVTNHINKALRKRNINTPVFTSAKEASAWATAALTRMDVADHHIRKALKITLGVIYSRIEEIKMRGTVEEKLVTEALRQLESQRGRLKLAGEIAADTTVANTYAQLKIGAKAGVRDFNLQAVNSICSKIDHADPEELEMLEPKIQAYLRKVWDLYQQELNKKLEEEFQQCYSQLMERVEADAGTMLSELDDDTQQVVQAAISGVASTELGTPFSPDPEIQHSNSLITLKTETRNLMLLSIPLAFTYPVLSLALIFGVRHYKKTQSKKLGEDSKAALKSRLKADCDEAVEEICREIDLSFDDAAAQMASSILEAYKSLTDNLISQLRELCDQQQELMARMDKLRQMQSVTIPGLVCNL